MSESAAHMNYKELYEASLQMNQQLLKSLDQQQKSNQSLQDQVTQLQYQLQQLTKLLKGFKSERFVPAGATQQQPELGFAMEITDPSTDPTNAQKISYTKLKKASTQPIQDAGTKLPDHLRRETTVLEPQEDISDCVKVGEEIRETLSWQPGEVFVNRIVIPVYSRAVAGKPGKEVIIKSPLPTRAIGKCLADPALLAQITVDKLVDHKPLNRQLESFNRMGLVLPYSTMADWVGAVAKVLVPLGTIQLKEMYKYNYWHADETGIAVLDKAKQKETHKGYFWTYLTGDGRMIYYDYQPGRGGDKPVNILKDFKGHLQVDGYAVYDELPIKDIAVFYCMAHARRKIYDAQGNNLELAQYALEEIAKLYAIEAACKEEQLDEVQIRIRRQEESQPILTNLGAWMKKEYESLRPKTPIAQAFAYSIKRWEKLSLYASTGNLQIDNNSIERCMRNVAIGRKNYLFCGSHEAAARAGLLYSLLVTCKLNNVNPYEWLEDVLSHDINEMPINQIKTLLPHNWNQTKNRQ